MGHRFNNPGWGHSSRAQKTECCRPYAQLAKTLPRASDFRTKLAFEKVTEAWWYFTSIAFAFAVLATPAQATVITIDIDYIERDFNIVCQPCGPSTITFNFDDNSHVLNWTFDWYGWSGMAHDAYATAIGGGTDLFDLDENDPAGLDDWLIDHPNGVAFSRLDNVYGLGVFSSEWTVSLYNLGERLTTIRDLLQVGPLDGFWRTDNMDDTSYYQSYFTVTGIRDEAPPPVPEPGTLGLFLAAAAIGLGAKRWPRH
jgi:hypothetical protein